MVQSQNEPPELPAEFLERLARIVPTDLLEQVITSFADEKPTSFRINTLVDSRDRIIDELRRSDFALDPVDWVTDAHGSPIAYQIPRDQRASLTHGSEIDAGKIYIQNLSSMLAPIVLGAQPGEMVLDLAAAPGGKTTQLAQMMNNQGVLSAVEAVRGRMFKLQANLKRCHVEIVRTYLTDGRSVGRKTPERFDRVLLDAPCSSEARFRAENPDSWAMWSPRKIRETSRKQIGLLKAAIHATKLGGRIVYCTCSFAPEENEQVVHKALKKFGEAIEIVPIDLPIPNWCPGLTSFDSKQYDERLLQCRRIIPNQVMDAFFLTCIRKKKPTQKA